MQEAPAVYRVSETVSTHASENTLRALPAGWKWVTVGEMVEEMQYGTSAKTSEDATGVPVLRMGNIKEGSLVLDSLKYLPRTHGEFPALLLHDGDLLFNRTNSAELVGKSAVYRGNPSPCSCASYLIRARMRPSYVPEFLAYYINSTFGRAWVNSVVSQQVGQANVNGTKLKALTIPVPHLPEQRRIVAEIEKQFTRLEAGVAALRRVKANLKRYRAAILKAACEGRLMPTESEWQKTTLGEVLAGIEAGRSFKCEERPPKSDEIGVVKVSSVTWGSYNEMESKTCLDATRIEDRFFVRAGDFLFSRANTIELVGACVIAETITLRLMLSDKILRLRFSSSVNPNWILYWLRSGFGRSEIERLATGNQNSMRNIGQDRIRQIIVKLPTPLEQTRIVAEIERRLSVVDDLETAVSVSVNRAIRLRHSILQKAYNGKL